MYLSFIRLTILFLSVFVIFNNPCLARNSEIIYDDCSLMKMSGVKTGYFCTVQRQKTENRIKYIVTDRHFEQTLKRLNKVVKTVQDINYVEEKKSGKPVSFTVNSKSSGETIKISGKFISPKEIDVNFSINGVKTSKNVELSDKVLFPYAIDNLYKYSDAKTVNYSTIEPSIDLRVIKIETKKTEQENLKSDGLNHKYNKYEVSMSIFPGIKSYEWRDKNGKVVKEYNPLMEIELIKTNKKDVLNDSYAGDYDLFSKSLISVDKPIGNPDLIDQITYKIKVFDVPSAKLFMQSERQKITQLKDNELYLKINSEKQSSEKYSYPVETKGMEEYLKTGPFIMPDSDKISAAAKSIASGETDAYVIAKKMENWVYNNITGKDYSLDFANAIETFETRRGDCTEHSVLLASLLRAVGIPSRVIIGLIYVDNPKPAFSYHMWVQAYVGKKQGQPKWVNLDAALPYRNFVATHIALSESPLNNISDRGDILIDVIKSFYSMKIEVLNADMPVIANSGKGFLQVNLGNANNNDILTIKNVNNSLAVNTGIKNINLDGKDEKDYIRSAYYNFIKGNIQEALNDFNICFDSISPDDDYSYMKIGLKLTGLGFFNLASKSFDRIKDKDIWNLKINNTKSLYFPQKRFSDEQELMVADLLSKIDFQSRSKEAIDIISKHNELLNNNDYIYYLLAKAHISENSNDQAKKTLEKAIEINPENVTYRMEKAKIYIKENDYDPAERELRLVKRIAEQKEIKEEAFWQEFNAHRSWLKYKFERTNLLRGKFYKAKYYVTKKEYDNALDILNDLLLSQVNDDVTEGIDKSAVYETLGNIYIQKGQLDEAKTSFLRALEYNENSPMSYAGLGEIYYSRSEYNEALGSYAHALSLKPENEVGIKLKIAEILETLGQEEEAFKYYRAVLLDAPMDLEANYSIGIMYLKAGDVEEAKKMFKKALSVDPMYSLIWLNLAGLEITQGNYTEAVRDLKPVSYIDNENPYYYYYTGMIYKAQGNFDLARENFDKAIELKPDFNEVNQVLERL